MTFDLIAFDADDTLWENEAYYRRGRRTFDAILQRYGISEEAGDLVHQIEVENLEYYGYGAGGFAISLVEAAIQLTNGEVRAEDVRELLSVGKEIIGAEVELFDGVEETVEILASSYPLMLVTKGDLLHQQSKVDRSGLAPHFRFVEVVSTKVPATYTRLLADLGVKPSEFLMIGNSMKSDVLPVLDLGGCAIYLHNELTWDHESVPEADLPPGRALEVGDLREVPEAVRSLERSRAEWR